MSASDANNGVRVGPFGEKIYPPIIISNNSVTTSVTTSDSVSTSAKHDNASSNTSNNSDQVSRARPRMTATEYLIKMKNGRERLKTFSEGRWPVAANQSPLELAEAGFFYLHDQDRVQCAFCKGVIKNWVRTDVPIREHAKHFKRCPFIMGYDVGNVPITDDPVRGARPQLPCLDVCGNYNYTTGRLDPMPAISRRNEEAATSDDDLQRLDRFDPNNASRQGDQSPQDVVMEEPPPMMSHIGPKMPNMASPEARAATFRNPRWPANCPVNPTDMVEAGLYYIGTLYRLSLFSHLYFALSISVLTVNLSLCLQERKITFVVSTATVVSAVGRKATRLGRNTSVCILSVDSSS